MHKKISEVSRTLRLIVIGPFIWFLMFRIKHDKRLNQLQKYIALCYAVKILLS